MSTPIEMTALTANYPIALFALATLIPVPLLALAAVLGGIWGVAAVLYMTAFAAILDEAVAWVAPATGGDDFPAATNLCVALALAHFVLLALAVVALSGHTGLDFPDKAALFAAAAIFFGQVSNANAHELIHRSGRGLRRLGKWVFISHLVGHHASAHPLVHHMHVATRADPATARLGENYYRFAVRWWRGGFRLGHAAETALLDRAQLPRSRHPYRLYVLGAAGFCSAALLVGGLPGLIWYGMLALAAQSQLILSDYVQHYGLLRDADPDGQPLPVGPQHSWNSPHPMSSALLLNAPRHSDHHGHPARQFPALRMAQDAPVLPYSLPAMSVLALVPSLWRRTMDPRVGHMRAAAIAPK